MKSDQVDDALESLWVLVQETSPLVIGSQALHGKYPDVADTILFSREVDVILPNKARLANWISDVVGDGTPFEAERGYFIDHVLMRDGLPILAEGWDARCTTRPILHRNAGAARARFLSPEDLSVSKLGAGRPKDVTFVAELIRRGLVHADDVHALVPSVPPSHRGRVEAGLRAVEAALAESDDDGPAAGAMRPAGWTGQAHGGSA